MAVEEAVGARVTGPSALGSDPRRLWALSRALAVTDFRFRFFGSVLGYVWQLMRPLLLFGVLYTVFSVFFNFGANEKYYPVALLLGLVMFSFLADATTTGLHSLVFRESLLRKIEFPRLAVPLSAVLTALLNFALNLIPVVIFLLAAGGRPRWSWLELPVLFGLLALLALGLAMLLSALFVRYRDLEPIWDVVLQVMFYASPILYTTQLVSEKASPTVAHLIMLNPFAMLLQQARHALVDPSYESAAAALGSTARLALPTLILVAVVALGFSVFNRMAPAIAEEL